MNLLWVLEFLQSVLSPNDNLQKQTLWAPRPNPWVTFSYTQFSKGDYFELFVLSKTEIKNYWTRDFVSDFKVLPPQSFKGL